MPIISGFFGDSAAMSLVRLPSHLLPLFRMLLDSSLLRWKGEYNQVNEVGRCVAAGGPSVCRFTLGRCSFAHRSSI